MFVFALFLFSIITSDEIINSAQQKSFYYKNVNVKEVNMQNCERKNNFVKKSNHCWKLIRQDKTKIELLKDKDSISIDIVPDKVFSRYYLYVENRSKVTRFVIKKRKIEVKNCSGVTSIQITAVGGKGPEVIYQRDFIKKKKDFFALTVENSLNKIRSAKKRSLLKRDSKLDFIAERRCKGVSEKSLYHYDSVTGSVAHNNLKSRTIGENLFIAENEKDAWKMMINSPSHLFNIIHPDFTKYGISIKKRNNKIYGAVIFSR